MIKRATLEFHVCDTDLTARVTKFGGQPAWLEAPQWPLSRKLATPMRFICQIALDDRLFPGCGGKMAYLFMTDSEQVTGTWESDGGENALILQPGGTPSVPVAATATGPTLQDYVAVPGCDRLQPKDVIVAVTLPPGEDPEFIPQDQAVNMGEDAWQAYSDPLSGCKLGGTPGFLQSDEFPDQERAWKLLLQLDSSGVPFSVNFGDSGVGYAFINAEASEGRFLWQCC